jgi:hypothetical protein
LNDKKISFTNLDKEQMMPVKLLVRAMTFGNHEKGDVVSVLPEGADYGNKECLPNYIRLIITDATRDEVQHYTFDWQVDFSHTLVNENTLSWRYRIETDPVYVSASDVGKNVLKEQMKTHCEGGSEYWAGCSVVQLKVDKMVVDIPKNGPYQTASGLSDFEFLKLLKSDFSDIFKTRLAIRRYYFAEADVDQAIALGGTIELTKLQALNKVVDRLEE